MSLLSKPVYISVYSKPVILAVNIMLSIIHRLAVISKELRVRSASFTTLTVPRAWSHTLCGIYDTNRACRREDTTSVLSTTGDPNDHLAVWGESKSLSQQCSFELSSVLFVNMDG